MQKEVHDVLVVGGGINGAVSASSLAFQGLDVVMVEKGDFASMTSQASSNMVWGGIKYLQSAEFKLVYDLCESRNKLMEYYPSRVREISYFTSFYKGNPYSSKLLYAGAWFYWFMGQGKTFKPRLISKDRVPHEAPLLKRDGLLGAVSYADACLPDNDARFVYQFVLDARKNGAKCSNYSELLNVDFEDGYWRAEILDLRNSQTYFLHAKTLVNACGPLISQLGSDVKIENKVAFSKGVHLIVPKFGPADRVLTFFSRDKRLFFVLPMGNRSCIGTTDTRVSDSSTGVTDEDRDFILENINSCLKPDSLLKREDIIAERCGVRTLILEGEDNGEDWIKLTRKHKVEVHKSKNLVNIVGGKITDCLNVGEEIADDVCSLLSYPKKNGKWYGEPFGKAEFLRRADDLPKYFDGLHTLPKHLWRRYGQEAHKVLDLIADNPELCHEIQKGSGYIKAEFAYMGKHEDVLNLDDVLRRRTTLGMQYKLEEMNISEMTKLLNLKTNNVVGVD